MLLHQDVSLCFCRVSITWFCVFTSCVDPLLQTNTQPGVTFYDEPVKKQFTYCERDVDLANGVKVTVSAIAPGSTVSITVQPSLAPRGVFKLPEGIVSASPSYLFSVEGLNGKIIVDMEHHVQVTSQEEANNLSFFEADSSPTRSGGAPRILYEYDYRAIPESNTVFAPGENKGELKLTEELHKFFKVGRKTKGMYRL